MNSLKNSAWELLTGVFIIAVVFMVARPGSPASKAIADVSGALEGLIMQATHYSASNTATATAT